MTKYHIERAKINIHGSINSSKLYILVSILEALRWFMDMEILYPINEQYQ
jgi:hypothetical protein